MNALNQMFWPNVIGIPLALFRAWVLTCLWVWFVTPVFGVAVPTLVVAWGLMIVWNFLSVRLPTDKEIEDVLEAGNDDFWKFYFIRYAVSAGGSAFVLLVGWILSLFH